MTDILAASRPVDAESSLDALREENRKLRKINHALMGQVERGMDLQGNAYSLFQTAIALETTVGERTRELEKALHALESSNHALSQAKERAETAESRLRAAISAVSEGFAMYDSEDRLLLFNRQYRNLWPEEADFIATGTRFETILRESIRRDMISPATTDPEHWIAERISSHRDPLAPRIIRMARGRWVQISDRRTADGSVVSIYTDVTEFKLSETRRRQKELAEKSALLDATINSLDQGVSAFDRDFRLLAWNRRFEELLGMNGEHLVLGLPVGQLERCKALAGGKDCPARQSLFRKLTPLSEEDATIPLQFEHENGRGRMLEVRRTPMPDGGFVATYSDISERKNAEMALRDSEKRLRLITDAMPALIAYVDGDMRYQFTNHAYEIWFNRPRSEINGRHMSDVLGPELYEKRKIHADEALEGHSVTFEMSMPSEKLSIEYALATYIPHLDQDGQVVGFFALIQDITERRRAAQALQEANEGLEQRVAERTRRLLSMNEELVDARARAEEANQSKTRFLAAASHDLLQPLNAARLFVGALSERRMAVGNRGLVENVSASLDAVDELLGALLEISKLDAGAIPVDITEFPIRNLLDPLLNEYGPQAASRGLELRGFASEALVCTDGRLLGRVMRNFLTNALRYTAEGRILLGCWRRGDHLRVAVADSGIGIPEDKQKAIFEEFHRLREHQGHETDKGVGLGLAIADRIARRLGHRIHVASVPGRGSVFAIDLPLGRRKVTGPVTARPASPARDRLRNVSVLVVDNEAAILAGMEALLGNWGCETLASTDQDGALQKLEKAPREPDILIADLHLDNGALGVDVIRSVRLACGRKIPAVIITADRSDSVIRLAEEHDCQLLNKPLKPAHLRSLLSHMVERG